jgi:hypothetical protein
VQSGPLEPTFPAGDKVSADRLKGSSSQMKD